MQELQVSKYVFISGPYLPVFRMNAGNNGLETTTYLDTFHAVKNTVSKLKQGKICEFLLRYTNKSLASLGFFQNCIAKQHRQSTKVFFARAYPSKVAQSLGNAEYFYFWKDRPWQETLQLIYLCCLHSFLVSILINCKKKKNKNLVYISSKQRIFWCRTHNFSVCHKLPKTLLTSKR